jgi:hypothetical protein
MMKLVYVIFNFEHQAVMEDNDPDLLITDLISLAGNVSTYCACFRRILLGICTTKRQCQLPSNI